MIMELLGHPNYVRVLLALRREGRLRFSQLEEALDLNPNQLDRALKFLSKGLWIVPRTVPTEETRVPVEYGLGKRGAAFLELFDSLLTTAQQRSADLGPAEVRELQHLAQ